MHAPTRDDIRAGLVNATRSERAALTFPAGFADVAWDRLDFYGWRDPKIPQRGYLVRVLDDEVVTVTVSTSTSGLASGRKAMCDVCRAVDSSSAVSLFAARRAGPAGRQGNTVGTYICSDLDCSVQLRTPGRRAGRTRPGTQQDPDVLAVGMLQRLDAFLDLVRRDAHS